MSEKGALRTPFIKRMYYLEVIRSVVSTKNYQEILVELEDKELLKILVNNKEKFPTIIICSPNARYSNIAKRVLFWMKVFLNVYKTQVEVFTRILLFKMMGIKKDKTPKKSILLFSFFPYFWIKSSKIGYFENFFKSAPQQISKFASVRFAVWCTFNSSIIWKKRKEIKNDFDQQNIIPIESYLQLKDFFYVFLFSLQYLIKILKYRITLQHLIKEYYEGYNITNIVIDEFNESLHNSQIINCIFISKAIENIVIENAVSAIVYRIEFQPHERAIEYGVKNRCATVAFQHQAIGRNHLQYFFAKNELAQYYSNRNNPDNLPLPDKFIVTGEYPFIILKNAGFPEKKINICGPVRYASLVEYIKGGKSKSEMRKKYGLDKYQHIFLITSPSVREEMLNLMFSLVQVLKEKDINSIFFFKSHPAYKFDNEVIDIIKKHCPNMKYSFLPDDVNLNEYLVMSDALILTATTVGMEAISLGTVPIVFENNSTFSLNPLIEITNSYLSVRNPKELQDALYAVMTNDIKILELKKHWPEAIKKLFYNIEADPNLKFASIIKSSIK